LKISFIDIQNFRKLKCCHIGLGEKETVFVGANNSGKTSASDALIKFLEKNDRHRIANTRNELFILVTLHYPIGKD
jgi:predicted ATP-dependent endonuclease of OLD family